MTFSDLFKQSTCLAYATCRFVSCIMQFWRLYAGNFAEHYVLAENTGILAKVSRPVFYPQGGPALYDRLFASKD